MLLSELIKQNFKESTRSYFWQKQLALNIVIGFLLLILFLYLLALGLFLDKILIQLFPESNPATLFNGFLLYYFIFELLMRFMIQSLPTINIESYLHLPIKKTFIIHYLNFRSVFVIGNYLPLLVIIPFGVNVISTSYGGINTFTWIISLFLLVFANNYFALFLKRQLVNKPYIVGVVAVLLVLLFIVDYLNVFSLKNISSLFFGWIAVYPLTFFLVIGILAFAYLTNYFFLKSKLYPEDFASKSSVADENSKAFSYLKHYGFSGQLLLNDLRLIWRNKRTRTLLFMAPAFLCYGFLIYNNEAYKDRDGFYVFVAIFMVGGLMLNYLNYAFSYESSHFDFILTNYKSIEKYISQKLVLGIAISTISYVITIPYAFYGTKILFINTMAFLYNIGILSYLLLYMATFSKKRMDLGKGAAFNYQGVGANNWLTILPFFLMPLIVYVPFSLTGYNNVGLIFIGAIGLLGLLFRRFFTELIIKQFKKKKYAMAEGFRSDF